MCILVEIAQFLVVNRDCYLFRLASLEFHAGKAHEFVTHIAVLAIMRITIEIGIELHDFRSVTTASILDIRRYGQFAAILQCGCGEVHVAVVECGVRESVTERIHRLLCLAWVLLALAVIHVCVAPFVNVVFHHSLAAVG